ncbi:MAG: hypothetical protein ACTSRI_07680, partial [Promethearchaeota archaeon]
MIKIIKNDDAKEDPVEGLCDIFICYYDEAQGHVPLLICPNETIKDDSEKMKPIYYHSIWFLDKSEITASDHIDLEYGDKIYIARKIYTTSKRKKQRAGLEDETPETIVIIIVLPIDVGEIFGGELLNKLTVNIQKKFEQSLYKIIECEIAKKGISKTAITNKIIEEGTKIKEKLREEIKNTCKEYFSSVIKQADANSIKKQKAISFLSLKGIDITHIVSNDHKEMFSNIRLFNLTKKSTHAFSIKTPFKILDVSINKDNNELEIVVKNNKDKEIHDIYIRITHVKDFFEKDILTVKIEHWCSQEDILFSAIINASD